MKLILTGLFILLLFPPFALSTLQLRNITNTPTIDEKYPAWSPDGTKIAFSRYYDSYANIYVMPANGGPPTQLTFNSYKDEIPAWSPDGAKIAFYSNRSGNTEIWTVPSTGGSLVRITNGSIDSGWPTWSPDNQQIAFDKYDGISFHLWRINLTTYVETQITNSYRKDRCPDWSNDGQWLAFNGGATDTTYWIYKIKPDGTNDTLILNKGYFPAWSPDGTLIAYHDNAYYPGYVGNTDIFVINTITGQITNLTNDPEVDYKPDWSPDGRKIVFCSSRNYNWELFIIEDVKEGMKSLGEIKAMYAE